MKMIFEEFEHKIEYLPMDMVFTLRNKYIDRFIDTDSDHYKKFISTVSEYSDGMCYTGYLWDCLINPIVINLDEVISYREKLKQVLIFWDIHSKEKIWVDDYWKFGKDSVLQLDYGDILDNLEYFPEDIYIFDESMEWTLVLTHEDNNGVRVCAKVGNI